MLILANSVQTKGDPFFKTLNISSGKKSKSGKMLEYIVIWTSQEDSPCGTELYEEKILEWRLAG